MPLCMLLVTVFEWCATLPSKEGGGWCVIEDVVLFIYSVQPGCKFLWLLGFYALHPTGISSDPSSARLPSQVIA